MDYLHQKIIAKPLFSSGFVTLSDINKGNGNQREFNHTPGSTPVTYTDIYFRTTCTLITTEQHSTSNSNSAQKCLGREIL